METDNGQHPFIKCCLELGLIEFLTDYMKMYSTPEMIQFACDVFNFLTDHVDDLYDRLQRNDTITVLNDLKRELPDIQQLVVKMSWKFNIPFY